MCNIWAYGFDSKKPRKPKGKLRKKSYVSIGKKLAKLDEKIRRKTEDLFNKKTLERDGEMKRKNRSFIFAYGKKPPKFN